MSQTALNILKARDMSHSDGQPIKHLLCHPHFEITVRLWFMVGFAIQTEIHYLQSELPEATTRSRVWGDQTH